MSYPVRVLVCDDESSQLRVVMQQLGKLLDPAAVEFVGSAVEAKAKIDNGYFDIAFVDHMFHNSPDGLDIIRYLSTHAPSCFRVLMTRFGRENFAELFRLAMPSIDGKVSLLNKTDSVTAYYETIVTHVLAEQLKWSWNIEGLDSVAERVSSKRNMVANMRSDLAVVKLEVLHIIFKCFNDALSIKLGSSEPATLELLPLEGGQSGATVIFARPRFGVDRHGRSLYGTRCVLKIGTRASILDEVSKYSTHVRLGVPTNFRVELVSYSDGHALAGVCYTFASAADSDRIESVDTLVDRGEVERVESVVQQLFSVENTNWYSIEGPPARIRDYYTDHFKTDFISRIRAVEKFMERRLGWKYERGKATFQGFSFQIPQESDLGTGEWQLERRTCLTHGDLHGGNILVSDNNRISLIDYATAGFGPAFTDGAALAGTFRLNPLSTGAVSEVEAAASYKAERALFRGASLRASSQYREIPWYYLSEKLTETLLSTEANQRNLPDEASLQELRVEFALTQLQYALSVFTLRRWNSSQKMRLIAWMAAARSVVVDAEGSDGN